MIDRERNAILIPLVLGVTAVSSDASANAIPGRSRRGRQPGVKLSGLDPVRRWWVLQSMERRFSRAHRDAEVVLYASMDWLRSETTLDAVTEHPGRAVDRSVQPETASVWRRETT